MRIAHVIRRLSFADWGGTEQVVWNLAKAQLAAGHDVRLFATTALCATARETVDGIEIFRFKPLYPWWPMPKRLVAELDRKGGNPFVPGMGRALREWRPEVIHCHAMARIAELCLRTAAKTGAKCVVSLHGGGANVPGEEARSLKAPTRGRLPWGKMIDYAMGWTRRVPEDADGIVCVGEDEYERYKARHPHVLFLPNGVDTALFAAPPSPPAAPRDQPAAPRGTPLPAAPRDQPASPRGTPQPVEPRGDPAARDPAARGPASLRLLCVARIDRQKNQGLLVEWLARHPEAALRLVGPATQPDYRDEIEVRAKELGAAGRLSFAGALKPGSPELLAEFRDADVFVLPSRHEPFGIAVLEAWAAGLPVVASDVGGLGRLCAAHPGAARTFVPGDLGSLDQALAEVAASPSLRRSLAEAGRRAAHGYDWRVLNAKLVDFYREL